MKYRLTRIDTTTAMTEKMADRTIPVGVNPVAHVAGRLKSVDGSVGAIIMDDDGKPVTTLTYFKGMTWVVYDHKEQDWIKSTLDDMEKG